jgi:hypothetical protein
VSFVLAAQNDKEKREGVRDAKQAGVLYRRDGSDQGQHGDGQLDVILGQITEPGRRAELAP